MVYNNAVATALVEALSGGEGVTAHRVDNPPAPVRMTIALVAQDGLAGSKTKDVIMILSARRW